MSELVVPEKRITVEDALDGEYRVCWSVSDHWADVQAYRVIGHDADDAGAYTVPIFATKGAMSSDDATTTLDASEPDVAGFIKWDGCSELDQGDQHWCGAADWALHIELLGYLWRRAFELMHRQPWDADLTVTASVTKIG